MSFLPARTRFQWKSRAEDGRGTAYSTLRENCTAAPTDKKPLDLPNSDLEEGLSDAEKEEFFRKMAEVTHKAIGSAYGHINVVLPPGCRSGRGGRARSKIDIFPSRAFKCSKGRSRNHFYKLALQASAPGQLLSFSARSTFSMRLANANRMPIALQADTHVGSTAKTWFQSMAKVRLSLA